MKQLENERHQLAEAFVSLVVGEQKSLSKNQEQTMMPELLVYFNKEQALGISFLLHHVPAPIVRQFFNNYLYSTAQQAEAKTEILVRPIPDESTMRGNTGRYLIYLRHEDGTEQHLKFTNKSATVYYLMYLIDRHQKEGFLDPLSLKKNKDAFTELYCLTYDITRVMAMERCENLIQRMVDNKHRVGRVNEVIYDIRRHLATAFREHGDDYRPYAMSAHTHLIIPASKIHFMDQAEALLQMNFK